MLSESTAETRRSIILDEEPAITPHPPTRLLMGILTCLLYPRRHGVAPPLHNGDVNVCQAERANCEGEADGAQKLWQKSCNKKVE